MAELPESYIADLEKRYKRLCSAYWKKRIEYSNYLSKHDPELWRLLVPCDPVITVAPDCLFFECFSADESSYGCLTVDRGGLRSRARRRPGHDQRRLFLDALRALPAACGAIARRGSWSIPPASRSSAGAGDGYREEKIDLPPSWLRGFLQLQAAMSLPMRRVPIGRGGTL